MPVRTECASAWLGSLSVYQQIVDIIPRASSFTSVTVSAYSRRTWRESPEDRVVGGAAGNLVLNGELAFAHAIAHI
jgi:hypothetical protein